MAEITTPKPYRDFKCTDRLIDIQSGVNVKESFEGLFSQTFTFDSPRHGFSVTNDSSRESAWNFNLLSDTTWESGTILTGGSEASNSKRIRSDFIPIPKQGLTISCTATSGITYQALVVFYDINKNYASSIAFQSLPFNYENKTYPYVRLLIRDEGESDINPKSVLSDMTQFGIAVSTYTAPSNVTVKVAESVPIPSTVDGWFQGTLASDTGRLFSSERFVTSDYILVNPLMVRYMNLTFYNVYYYQVFEYREDKTFIASQPLTSPTMGKKLNLTKETRYIRLMLRLQGTANSTPESLFNDITHFSIIGDKITVLADDTQKIIMPPFTSLYIESNVPYHGHVYDLYE